MAKEKLPKKAAPEVGLNMDPMNPERRTRIIADLEENDPDFVYSYQKATVEPWELEAKNQEMVKTENGKQIRHGFDPVVKQPRAAFEAMRKSEGRASRDRTKAVVNNPRLTVKRNKRTPTDVDDD